MSICWVTMTTVPLSSDLFFIILFLLAIRIKYILWANLLSSCAYYVMMRSSPVRGPLQPSIRSMGQDSFNFLLCYCSSKGHEVVYVMMRSSPVSRPLQTTIRSTGQDFFNLLLCCCSSRGLRVVYVMMRSSPVRGPLQPSIRSTGQDFLTFFCVVALVGAMR
jgi:hypothetical protein